MEGRRRKTIIKLSNIKNRAIQDFSDSTQTNNTQSSFTNHPEDNLNRSNISGRHQTNQFERERRKYKSQTNVVLNSYYDCQSVGFMKIFKNLCDGVQSWEILDFLSDYTHLLNYLNLLIEDSNSSMQIQNFQTMNFTKQFLTEPVPRTLVYGLIKARQQKRIKNCQIFMQMNELELKSLYIAHVILIGVGQIDRKIRTKDPRQSNESYFHRIVTYLLDTSNFLTPKLFYYLSGNWKRIMEIIQTQIQIEKEQNMGEKRSQSNSSGLARNLEFLNIQQFSEQLIENGRQNLEKAENHEEIHYYEDMENELFENLKFDHNRKFDQDIKFLSGSKSNTRQQKKEIIKQQNPQTNSIQQAQKYKGLNTMVLFQGSQNTNKKDKDNSTLNPAFKKAVHHYNYWKSNTRDRSKKTKKISKMKSKQSANDKIMKAKIGLQNQKTPQKRQQQELFVQNDSLLFIDKPEPEYKFDMDNEMDSLDLLFSDSFRSSQNEENKINSEEVLPNIQSDNEEIDMQSENTRPENPNRRVRHENRQIDNMLDNFLENRFVMAHSIANHIYHALKVAKVQLIKQKKQTYRRNLMRDFGMYD